MRIVHYLIGLPPLRHGGASKYAVDLFLEQNKQPNIDVFILIPGETLSYRSQIVKISEYFGISQYAINNPVIPSLLFGVKNPRNILQHKYIEYESLNKFYEEVRPDIIHFHTLMGLSIQFVEYMKNKGVKLLYTSHDYYGICAKVNLITSTGNVCETPSGIKCAECNLDAPNIYFLKLCNSRFFLKYKHHLPTWLRNKGKKKENNSFSKKNDNYTLKADEYDELIIFYKKIFSFFDTIHFNSDVAKNVFNNHLKESLGEKITITTSKIQDNRILKKEIIGTKIQLGFIGGIGNYKGFPLLKKNLIKLYNEGWRNWTLSVWEDGLIGIDDDCKLIEYKGAYTTDEIEDVFVSLDLLIVPSIWKETFSLVTLEALSYGTPVLVSCNVGAQDVVKRYDKNFIYETEDELYSILECLFRDPKKALKNYIYSLNEKEWIYSEELHVIEMINLYNKLIEGKDEK